MGKKGHLKAVVMVQKYSSANKGVRNKVIKECTESTYYHRFLIDKTGSYDKDYILKSIWDFVYPSPIIPINFKQLVTSCQFIARDCFEAMTKIMDNKCDIPHIRDPTTPFVVTLMFNYYRPEDIKAPIIEVPGLDNSNNVQIQPSISEDANLFIRNFSLNTEVNNVTDDIGSNIEIMETEFKKKPNYIDLTDNRICEQINNVIEKRFNEETKILDLSNFGADTDLTHLFLKFTGRNFRYLLIKARDLYPHEVNLQNNDITSIYSIFFIKNVKILDLSNNNLKHINTLKPLMHLENLTELSLSGNPLCETFGSHSYNYVVGVKTFCPNLVKLDGVDITTPQFRKNYMCNAEADEFAAQFVEYYFTIYDSSDRADLNKVYHPLAIFSVNAKIIPWQKNSETVNISHYGLGNPYAVYGMINIIKLFKEFPKTYHDPYPIVCDVTIYNDTNAQIVISGIFKEFNQILTFNRSFYFIRFGQEFRIANEQLHVSNALDYQLGWSFIFPSDVRVSETPLPYFYEQYKQLDEVLQKITNMSLEYCQKYLSYCNYDLKKALTLFAELHINKGVPHDAFIAKRETMQKTGTTICEPLQQKVVAKHGYISLKTLWDTVNYERLQSSNDPSIIIDPTIQKIYKTPVTFSTSTSNLDTLINSGSSALLTNIASSTYVSNSQTSTNTVPSVPVFNKNSKNRNPFSLKLIPTYNAPKTNQPLDSQKTIIDKISNKRPSETNSSKAVISKRAKEDEVQLISDKTESNTRSSTANTLKQTEKNRDILQTYSSRRDQHKKGSKEDEVKIISPHRKWSKEDDVQNISRKIESNKKSNTTSSAATTTYSLSGLKQNETDRDIIQAYLARKEQHKKMALEKSKATTNSNANASGSSKAQNKSQVAKNSNTNASSSSNSQNKSNTNLNTFTIPRKGHVQVPRPNKDTLEIKKKELASKIFSKDPPKSSAKKTESNNKREPAKPIQSRKTTQSEKTTQSKKTTLPEKSSQSEKTSQPEKTSQSQPKKTTQPEKSSQLEKTSQSEKTSQPQPKKTTQPERTSQPEKTIHPEKTTQHASITKQIQIHLTREPEKTIQSATTEEQISKSDASQSQENLGHDPKKTAQFVKTGEESSKNVDEIEENLKKQKQKLMDLKNQIEATTKLAPSGQINETSRQKLISNMRQKLQVEKERLLQLKSELDIKSGREKSSSVNSTVKKKTESKNVTQDQSITGTEETSAASKDTSAKTEDTSAETMDTSATTVDSSAATENSFPEKSSPEDSFLLSQKRALKQEINEFLSNHPPKTKLPPELMERAQILRAPSCPLDKANKVSFWISGRWVRFSLPPQK